MSGIPWLFSRWLLELDVAVSLTNAKSRAEMDHGFRECFFGRAAYIDSATSKTFLKKSEQHQKSSATQTSTQIRLTNIEFDFLNGQITESSTYQDLVGTKLISEWKVSSTVTAIGNALLMEINAGGNDSEIEFSLDSANTLNCVVN